MASGYDSRVAVSTAEVTYGTRLAPTRFIPLTAEDLGYTYNRYFSPVLGVGRWARPELGDVLVDAVEDLRAGNQVLAVEVFPDRRFRRPIAEQLLLPEIGKATVADAAAAESWRVRERQMVRSSHAITCVLSIAIVRSYNPMARGHSPTTRASHPFI